ncbi:MAG: hypothetical protein PHY93_17970 [Bacteriovorax sp.]|nr:hypothetical protein [Bacteriovorax sp.]
MKKLTFITILNLFITSCSFFTNQRMPATEKVVQADDKILRVFEFRSSSILNPDKDYRKLIQEYIELKEIFHSISRVGNEVKLKFVEDTTLHKDIAYFPELRVKENFYEIIVFHSKEAVNDAVASSELLNFLIKLNDEKYFISYFASFEMYFNATERDPVALYNWAKIREAANFMEPRIPDYESKVMDEHKIRGNEWSKYKYDYLEMAKKKLKLRKKQDLERRIVIDELDKATDDLQFKNLVAKNDRVGVSNLLKKYLPWEQMAPFEKRYWETYLETVVHPLPLEQRVFIYRGIDDDFLYSAFEDGKELEKVTAQKEEKIFMMSTILSKNQGTWNRRLRSLSAMNEKFIATNEKLENEFTQSARIVTMFVNHSEKAQGSPFLSFTPIFRKAQRFGVHKMAAYAFDPRLLSFNFTSLFSDEVEFLLPLVVFPEDLVGFYDIKNHVNKEITEDKMRNLFKEKLVSAHGDEKGEEIFQKVLKNSADYFDSALNRYNGKKTAIVTDELNLFAKPFNNISTHKSVVPTVNIAQDTGVTCMDIIAKFWK